MPPKNDGCGTCHTVKTPGHKEGSRGNIHDMPLPTVEIVSRGRPQTSGEGSTMHPTRKPKGM